MKNIIMIFILLTIATSANAHLSVFHELKNYDNFINVLNTIIILFISTIILMVIRKKINNGKKY